MSGPHRPTDAQARAADPSRSVWVTANAGTGKTRVLSDRVLRLLLDGADPEGILCITFTRAAAVEMMERIENALADWAVQTSDEALAARLEALAGTPPDRQRLARARRLFARVLDLPHGLGIMTVHSFCLSLLRRFPIEAGLPPHFETIDDRSAAEMMKEARAELLGERRDADPVLADALDRLVGAMAESTLGELLAEILMKRDALEPHLADDAACEALIERICKLLDVRPGEDPKAILRRACDDGVMDVHRLKAASDALLASSGKKDKERGAAIAAWLERVPADRERLFDEYRRHFITAKGTETKSLMGKAVSAAHPDLHDALIAEQVRLLRLDDALKAAVIAQRTAAILHVARHLLAAYGARKQREAALDFDDQINQAAALLGDPDRRAWVLYKLDARLEHLLVDEAQDTSPRQWRIIEHLMEEFLAGEGAHEGRRRTLFVVGDEKQSIYSFQGADLANFREVRKRLEERAAAAGQPIGSETLDLSFRTSSAVLETVDRTLLLDGVREGTVGEGGSVKHDTIRKNAPGEVVLWPLVPPPETSAESEPWPLPSNRPWQPSAEERLARLIARDLRQRIAAKEVMASTGRPLRPADIIILVSRRGRIQELVIRALKREGVPVAGADRLSLTGHIAVRDLTALGNVLLLPEDDLSLACLLKSPLLGLGEEHLFELAHGREQASLLERLRRRAAGGEEPYATAYERLADWLRRADFVPPFELFSGILAEGGRKRLLERLGPDAAEPVEAFLGQALAYESGHPASLQGFLHWLGMDEQKLKRDPEQARDEVRVMTVHGAKGLEAPLVILADCGPRQSRERDRFVIDPASGLPFWRAPKPEREGVTNAICDRLADAAAQEQARLLYVALTRAKDKVIVAGWLTRTRGNEKACWHGLVKSALESFETLERVPLDWSVLPNAEALVYRRGVAVDAGEPEAVPPQPPGLPPWALSKAPEEPPAIRHVTPSANAAAEPAALPPDDPLRRGGRGFGIELHRLLHRLADLDPGQREAGFDRLMAASGLAEPELAELRRQVMAVLDMPDLAPAFAPGSRAEQAIAGRLGRHVVSGQIDRFAVTPDAVLIVDFKSSRRPPADIAHVPESYLRQLGAYASLLMRLYPGREVRAGLVWTVVPQLMVVPSSHLAAYLIDAGGA